MVKVKLKKGALDYFRKLARNNKLEIQAYLVGRIVSPTEAVVERFAYTAAYYKQSVGEVSWSRKDFDNLKREAEVEGLNVIGDIHSHPSWDAVMSPDDYNGAIIEGLRICGICSVENKNTRVRFWIPESSLPCEIVYI